MCHKHLPMTTLKNRSDHAVTKLCLIYPPKLQCFCWGTWWLWDAMGIHLAHISGHPMALSHWYFASSKETSSPFEGSYLGSKMSKSTMFGPGAGWKYHAFLMVPLQISSVLNRWTSKIPYDCWWTPPFSHRSWLLGPETKIKHVTSHLQTWNPWFCSPYFEPLDGSLGAAAFTLRRTRSASSSFSSTPRASTTWQSTEERHWKKGGLSI